MKTKLKGVLTLLLALVVQFSFAQEKTVTGTVSDDSGPLPGVSISVKGTTRGTDTDFNGKYSIKAKTGDVLSFSYLGYETTTKKIGSSSIINVSLKEGGQVLEEIVVTAQGIKREKKALGYAVSEVSSDEIEQRAEGDVARILSGKASGVQITSQSGTSGSATNVVIRGYSSINGSNQALFVVDGVPFSSDTNSQGNFLDGNVGSSRFLDLDPNNIASVSVLKGLAAATLYGTAGRNGVIVITTKAGSASTGKKKKNEITINQSFFVNEIASVPDYQDQYGGGFDQSFGWFFSNWGPSFNAEGVDGYLNDPGTRLPDDPLGEKGIQPDGTVEHPYGASAFLNNYLGGNNILNNQYTGERYAWKPYNSVENFFRSGAVKNLSVNFSGSSDSGDVSYNANVGHLDEEGFTPGNRVGRTTISLGGRAKLSNKFTVSGSMNYSQNKVVSPPVAASRGNGTLGWSTFGNVFFTPRNVDLMGLPFELPEDGGSIYYRNGNDIINPLWSVKNAQNGQITNRVFTSATLSYEINENLGVSYRAGIDFYNERNKSYSNKNGVNFDAAVFGFLNTYDNNVSIFDHYIAVNGNYDLSEDFSLSFVAGATSRSRTFDRSGVASTGQIVFGVVQHFNFENQTPIQFTQKRNIVGAFGETSIDFRNYAFLTLSGRNDWVSNLPSENNSLFYPSISTSFIPTQAIEGLKSDSGKGLNYLKIRASLGQSAGFPTGYPTINTVSQSTQVNGGANGAITTNTISDFQANPNLKPELISEIEVGLDARLFDNRIDLSFSYFDRTTKDLIVTKPLAPSSGFTSTQANVGKVEGSGVEVDLAFDVFRNDGDGFNWNSRLNFTQNEQIVTEQEDDQIIYAGSSDPVLGGNAAIRGEQLGVIVGTRIKRSANGDLLVGSDGSYLVESNVVLADGRSVTPIIGDPNPDYVMNFNNTLNYKNFTFSFQINHTKGGDIASSTIATLLGRGLINGDRNKTFILPGILESTGETNTLQINNSQYYFSNLLFGPKELTIYDASVLRLQEVSLGYSLPQSTLEKTPFGAVSFTFSGFNLWYDAYNTPSAANFDPNVAGVGVGNGRGFDYLNGPSSKRYGFSVKLSF
jgi:TonB-linked SusC/RagA family outer membrane protein